jgi:hypothetical protein
LLQQYSAKTGEVIFSVPVGNNPQIPGVSSDESVICVPNLGDGTVTVFSPDFFGNVTLGGGLVEVAYENDSVALVTNGTAVIHGINTITGTVLPNPITLPGKVLGEVLTADKKTLYATGQNAVYAVDIATTQVITIPVAIPANNTLGLPTISLDEKFLYVPVLEIGGGTALSVVVVINIKQGAVVGNPISVGEAPVQLAITPTPRGTEGYVSNELSGTVTVIKVK